MHWLMSREGYIVPSIVINDILEKYNMCHVSQSLYLTDRPLPDRHIKSFQYIYTIPVRALAKVCALVNAVKLI